MENKIREISSEMVDEIIERRLPKGLFYYEYEDGSEVIIGIDNTTGDAWMEEFNNLKECEKWLNGEEAIDRFGVKHNY